MPLSDFPGPQPPAIQDYNLQRRIGRGAFGDVWIAQNITGAWRAIKVVSKDRFSSPEPYEREFRGLQRFTEVSLDCARQLALLHVGSNESAGFFYAVMELADDVDTGREINPETYVPLTLRELRARRGRLPAKEVVRIAVDLADALRELHDKKLIHRDIKPSNIILVGGVPKLADIGLVAHEEEAPTMAIGTEGYLPPEGPGKAQADIFATGKVLYELATGMDRKDYPRLPANISTWPDEAEFFELNTVIRRACEPQPEKRFASAAELLEELRLLQGGKSVIRLRFAELWISRAWKLTAAMLAVSLAFGWLYFREKSAERAQRERLADSHRQTGFRLADEGNVLGALPWFVRASELRPENSPNTEDDFRQLALSLQQSPFLSVMHRYSNEVDDVRFSSDNQWLAVAVRNGTIDLWKPGESKPTRTLTLPNSTGTNIPPRPILPRQVHFSRDGQLLVSPGYTDGILLWQMARLDAPPEILSIPEGCFGVALSADNRYLAASTKEHRLELWDLQSHKRLHELPGSDFSGAGFSPDGKHLGVAREGKSAHLYDIEDKAQPPKLIHEYPHDTWSYSVSFAINGQYLATACADQSVYVWNLSNTNLLLQLPHPALALDARYSADGLQLLTRAGEGYVRLWNVQNVRGIPRIYPHPENAYGADMSPDRSWIAAAGGEGILRIWHSTNYAAKPFTASWKPMFSVNDWFANSYQDGKVLVPIWQGQRLESQWTENSSILAFVRDEATKASIVCLKKGHESQVQWTRPSKNGTIETVSHILPTPCVQVLNTGLKLGRLLYRNPANELILVDLTSNQILHQSQLASTKHSHSRSKSHPSGEWFSVETTTTVDLINARTGQYLSNFATSETTSAFFKTTSAFSPDGRFLAASGASGDVDATPIFISEFKNNTLIAQPIRRLTNHTDGVCTVVFSPDSKTLVTVGEDRKAFAWDTATWLTRYDPMRHNGETWWAAISADSQTLLTASESHPGITDSLRLWDLGTGAPLSSQIIVSNDIAKIGYMKDRQAWVWTTLDKETKTLDPGRILFRPLDAAAKKALLIKAKSQMGYTLDSAGILKPIPSEELLDAYSRYPGRVVMDESTAGQSSR
jgi:WD40 repeat protein